MNSDKSAPRLGLVVRYLKVPDLKTSCQALSASVQWTNTICRGFCVPQPMRNCHESYVNKCLFQLGGDRLGSKASVWQANVPTYFNPICQRQKICSSTTKNRLVCGSHKSNQPQSNQIKCWFLGRGENQSNRRKTSRSRVENQQTRPTCDTESGNQTQATLVEGKGFHHCTMPAPLKG